MHKYGCLEHHSFDITNNFCIVKLFKDFCVEIGMMSVKYLIILGMKGNENLGNILKFKQNFPQVR